MTIASEQSKTVHVTDGVSVAFAVPFRFLSASHLRVIEARNNVETILNPTTGSYSVTGANNPQGGAVIITPPLAAGAKLIIQRIVPMTQETHYPRNDPFPASAHESALDKLTMITQQQAEQLNRAVKLPVSDSRTPEEFTEEFFQAAAATAAAANAAAASESAAAASAASASASAQQAQDRWNDISTKFTVSTQGPTGGKDGDIWFQVI